MIVYIDRQHAGKLHKPSDLGAGVDLNGDGRITPAEQEAIWTGRIAIELEICLRDRGVLVMPISDGSYGARHKRVNEYSQTYGGKQVYLAMHLNAGGGDYGAMFYDYRSTKGKHLAQCISSELQPLLEITQKQIPAKPDDWTRAAYGTIKGVQLPVAICVEPIFVDSHKRFLSQSGIMQIARGLAEGLLKWKNT